MNSLRVLFLIAGCLLLPTAHATVQCVNTSTAIVNAFAQANLAPGGTVQEIRVRVGTYTFANSLSFGSSGPDDKTFELTGGWNSDCSARTINPANTIFNGSGQGGTQFAFSGNQRNFRIEGIRFQNFGSFFLFENICPFGQSCPDTDSVKVRYNHFRLGTEVLIVANDAQTYLVANNLFEGIQGPPAGSNSEATIELGYANQDSLPQVVFNTFSLQCAANKPALMLQSERDNSLFSHNILQSTGCNESLRISSAGNGKAWRLKNNLYPAVNTGLPPAGGSSGNLVGINPQFVSSSDFHLRETAPVSPAINAGQTSVQASQDLLSVPAQDLDGPAGGRLVGSKYDMGAYESAVNDASIIVVTNNNDSGSGSLREAITSANAVPGLQKIHFNIPGGCTTPDIISLQSLLPDITDSLEIDGYSEPDASPNTLSVGSDAVICIVLFGLNASLTHALQVPDSASAGTSLTVKGIGFSSFESAVAIRLRGGSNHRIQGNAIGGVGPGGLGNLFSNAIGIQVRGNAQNALIGGPEPEDRNSIGEATTSAISLLDASSGGHTIQNNYIGLSASGLAASPIGNGSTGNGIFASNSPGIRILDNVIAAVPDGGAISISGSTATGYEIARNRIGTSASGIPAAAFRNGTGILITNGSGGHQIGGVLNQSVSNTITNSDGPGVHLTSSAGTGNSIRPNRIFANGISGTGLGIDLGDLGPLSNDPGDGDGGPNNGQNKPVLSDSQLNPDGTRQVTGLLNSQNGSFIIDIYRSPDCPASGGDLLNLVATEFVTNVLGSVPFSATIPGGSPGLLTAVATRISTGDTSEVSDCLLERHETVTTITSDTPDPSQNGQTITVNVQVTSPTGGTPTGTVAISGPAGTSCNAVLGVNGSGNCQLPSNSIGSFSLNADYPGNFVFLPSNATELHAYTAANSVTTILSDSPDPSHVGEPYTVTVQVRRQHDNAILVGGTVSISDGTGQTCQTAPLVNSMASCELTSVTVGSKTLTATYAGTLTNLSSSGTATHTVLAAATTTTITSDTPDPSLVNQPYTVAVTVSSNPGAGTPTGSVSVSDGSGAGCNIILSNGAGSCPLSSTSAGLKTLTASYTSQGQAFAASSDAEAHTVNPAQPAATTTLITGQAPNPSVVGQPYTVSVTVSSAGGTPSGTVTVNNGAGVGTSSCEITLAGGSGGCQIASLHAGNQLLTVCMQTNSSFAGSCDSAFHTTSKADTELNFGAITPSTPTVGTPTTVNVTVSVQAPGSGTPTGTVQISASPTESCTITLPASSCALSFTSAGVRTLTASYSGSADFNAASRPFTLTVSADALFANGFE
ncbi:MAG: Ig-like domain-containing protein [Lysobacterales bacterium]